MKNDAEVLIMQRERTNGTTQEHAAARAGMRVRTARTYERLGQRPSQRTQPRTWRTRTNPFERDWPWVQAHLERDPARHATTLFALRCQRHPGRSRATQVRTVQRHSAIWRAAHGPDKDGSFPHVHHPGARAQSACTSMDDLSSTIAGDPFPHMRFPMVRTSAHGAAVARCVSARCAALAAGIEAAVWPFGGVPRQHRTDHLGAAINPLAQDAQDAFRERYAALRAQYGMQPTLNTAGEAHANGDVEPAHDRFKHAVDHALRVRGCRAVPHRDASLQVLQTIVRQRNQTRQARWDQERGALQPLPAAPRDPCREERVTVSRFSTIRVAPRTSSVPSRCIGTTRLVRLRAETLDVYQHTRRVLTLPRVRADQHPCRA